MQALLFESPVWISLVGLALAAVTGFVWTQMGHKGWLIAAIAFAVLTLAVVVASNIVQTDSEQITATLHRVATALEHNDLEEVVRHIHPKAAPALQHVREEMPQYHFNEARVTRIRAITVDSARKPSTAVAEFNVAVTIELRGNRVPIRRFIKAYFTQLDGQWLVRDFEHSDARDGFTNQ